MFVIFSARDYGRKDHINMRILQTMITGIPIVLGLILRMLDPVVCLAAGPSIIADLAEIAFFFCEDPKDWTPERRILR